MSNYLCGSLLFFTPAYAGPYLRDLPVLHHRELTVVTGYERSRWWDIFKAFQHHTLFLEMQINLALNCNNRKLDSTDQMFNKQSCAYLFTYTLISWFLFKMIKWYYNISLYGSLCLTFEKLDLFLSKLFMSLLLKACPKYWDWNS